MPENIHRPFAYSEQLSNPIPLTVKCTARWGEAETTFEATGDPADVTTAFRDWLNGSFAPVKRDATVKPGAIRIDPPQRA